MQLQGFTGALIQKNIYANINQRTRIANERRLHSKIHLNNESLQESVTNLGQQRVS